MPALDLAQARELLLRVVQKYYSERHSPLPGAFVKAQMLAEAERDGNLFDEGELGFRKFIEFVRAVPDVGIQDRAGSDILLAPVTATEILAAYGAEPPRLRRDFWRAFVEFAVEKTSRVYDAAEDKILFVNAGEQHSGILIEPISKGTQLQWRRTFAEEQPEPIRSDFVAILDSPGSAVFNEFSRRLREDATLLRAWNRYFQKHVTDCVGAWADKNGVPKGRWLAMSGGFGPLWSVGESVLVKKPQVHGQRAELYNLLDQLPLEDLLQLQVPLEWLLKINQRGNS
jgi:hypothetical protein